MTSFKKTTLAVVLNVVLPGAGYLYLDAKERKPLGYFLVFITLYEVLHTLINITNGNTGTQFIQISPLFPSLVISPLGVMLAAALALDAYFVARRKKRSKTAMKN